MLVAAVSPSVGAVLGSAEAVLGSVGVASAWARGLSLSA